MEIEMQKRKLDREVREKEMQRIAKKYGCLRPIDVLNESAHPDAVLHDRFEWDDAKASHAYRLHQAVQEIQLVVTTKVVKNEETRLYVSLKSDRDEGNGYKLVCDVMNDDESRAEFVELLRTELRAMWRRFNPLIKDPRATDVLVAIKEFIDGKK